MSLLTETSPLGKRMFEESDHYQSWNSTPRFKRSYSSITRKFSSNSGPIVLSMVKGIQDSSSGADKSPNDIASSNKIVFAAKPLRSFAAPDAHFKYMMKPNVPDNRKIENENQKFMSKGKEKVDLPVASFGKVESENEELKTSTQPLKLASKYPLPKVRKGVTIFRSFPLNCGDSGRKNSESSNKLIEEEEEEDGDDEDCVIIGEKLANVCNENVVKDEYEPGPSKQAEEPYRCEFDLEEDEMEDDDTDEEICILTPSEWNQLQSGFKLDNVSKKDAEDELLAEETEKNSEECSIERFAEPDEEEPNAEKLENLCIVPYDAEKAIVTRAQVQESQMAFEELYNELYQEYKEEAKGGKITKHVHVMAAKILKKQQKWVNLQPIFGHVPGVEVGDEFQFRVQLAMVGLHHQYIAGINCVTVKEKTFVNSVVDSGRYENKSVSHDVIIYSGQGGNPKVRNLMAKSEDQKLEGANLALKNSQEAGLPIRVIRKTCIGNKRQVYIYEGLYNVTKFWKERTKNGTISYMFEMVRISSQSETTNVPRNTTGGYLEQSNSTVVADDLSRGTEKIPIRVVNEMSDEKPQPFTYINKMKYPDWYHISEPEGCDCIDGCSDSKPCYCSYKNGGEIPFNEERSILKAKRLVHECGPSCKCPPSCQNRVGQNGPRFQLEVYKTKSIGWGVRSRQEIPSGSFICEYIGELLPDKEAEKRTNDEYLFDLDDRDGFTIDAAEFGNVGRFINHSCSPNLYAQNVVYDNEDNKLPHIMLFATKKIQAFQELSYDYNYKIDRVCDANGNIKKKNCHCGARKCTGRMY